MVSPMGCRSPEAFEQGLNDGPQRLQEELRTVRRDCGENMIGSRRD
jgi:hypothetical protein